MPRKKPSAMMENSVIIILRPARRRENVCVGFREAPNTLSCPGPS
jgi:hypothetical protein